MKVRDRYLTGILLILMGILIGTIMTLYQRGQWVDDQAQVRMTEIKRSSDPIFSDQQLEKMDTRFLFKEVAKKVTPTVVYIETIIPIEGHENIERQLEEQEGFWDRILPQQARTVGSGVLISRDGYILTNNHVVEDAIRRGIRVVLNDKRVYTARVVGTDPTTDLAVIKIDARKLPAITIGNSEQVEVGEWVLAIGNPFDLPSTVTAGIVSALSRDIRIFDNQVSVESFIQTDAAINKGNSGGALVNTSGELIGVNTAIASQSGSYQGYGFAVPSNLALKVATDIIQYGEVRRALLGVNIQSVNNRRADELGMQEIRGVEIVSVSPGGAADKFDLKPSDVVLAIDGQEVNESNQLQEKVALLHPGDVVKLTVWRNGDTFRRNIKLGSLENTDTLELLSELSPGDGDPQQDQDSSDEYGGGIRFESFDNLGFRVMALSRTGDVKRFELIITRVNNGSEAEKQGLKEGDEIKKVGQTAVEDLESLKDLVQRSLEANGTVRIQAESREGATEFYELKQQ